MRSLLPLVLLCTALSAQEIDRIDSYLVGTRITYFMGQCGNELPQAAGRLSFCDGAGNQGVVVESLGLSGRGVLRMLPNYFDDSEVYVTRGGLSIHRPDGSWENVPNIAVGVRDFRGNLTNGGQIETGLVDASGLLHFNITSTSRRLFYTYDLRSKEIERVDIGSQQGVSGFAHDPNEDVMYVLGASFRDNRIYRYDPAAGTTSQVAILPELLSISVNSVSFKFHDAKLWLGTDQGLLIVDTANGFAPTPLTADNGRLPFDDINDIEFADDGAVWLAQGDANRGALTRLDLANESYTEYVQVRPDYNTIELRFQDLALLDDGRVTAVATNFFGYVDLYTGGGGTPNWTLVDRDSLDALGLTISYSPGSVERHAGRTYYLTNDFSSGNSDNAEVLVRDADDGFVTRNDNAPANYSYWEVDRLNYMLADDAGGVYLYSHFDGIISYVSPNEGIGSRTYRNLSSVRPTVDGDGRLVYIGRDAENRPAWNRFDQPFDQRIAGVSTSNVTVAAYGNTLAFFSRATGELIRAVNGRVVARDTLPAADSYGDFYTIGAGDGDRLWLMGQDRGQGTPIVGYHPATGDTLRFTPGQSTGNPVRVLAGPDGAVYFLAQRGLIYFDGSDFHVHTQQDYGELAGIRDGAVDTLGRFFLLSGSDGALHRVTGLAATPTFTTRRITELLPFIDQRGGNKLALDADGDLWIAGVAGIFQLRDELTAPAYRPRGNEYVLQGRVYADVNNNGQYDDGEGLGNQPVAVTVDGTTRTRLTSNDGSYATLLRQSDADYRVTLTTLDPLYYSSDRQQTVRVSESNRDYTVPDFRLEIKSYNSLYFQTANKQGAWGFDRAGFDNVFTTAVTNLSPTKTFRELQIGFVYFNQEPGTGNTLPDVVGVRVTRLSPTGVPLLVSNITISPRNHAWAVVGVSPDQYTREALALTPTIVSVPDSVTTSITLDALQPRETVVIEIETAIFQASSNGVSIGYSPSRTESPDLEGGNDNVNDNIVIIYPPEDGDLPGPVDPFNDPNSPYVSPDDIYEDPPYLEPEEVYAPPPYQTPIFSSYDPNDKLVDGGLANELNDTELDRRWLTYTIRFENTGNFSAKDVWIVDTLDRQFASGSLILLEASHDVEADYFSAEGDSLAVLRFSLEDIYLPFQDSINDGYVRFALRVRDGVDLGDIVTNQAAIYFDQNPPIITNRVRNRYIEVTTPVGAGPQVVAPSVEVFPNPAYEQLTIRTEEILQSVRLLDLSGRLVADYGAGATTVPLGAVPGGVYLLRVVTGGGGVGVRRVVVR